MTQKIDTDAYMQYSMQLKPEEIAMREILMSKLPEKIIDAHAHSCNPDEVQKLDDGIYNHMMSTFPAYPISQSQQVKQILFPGKQVRTVRFAHAFRGINHRLSNIRLLDYVSKDDAVVLYGIPDDVNYTTSSLAIPKVKGLKMYYQYFSPPATTIYQTFPPAILETAQALGKPIILHLPKMITQCVQDLEKLLSDFPRLKVILAHLGLPHIPVPELLATYRHFADFPNLFMDNSMIPSEQVTVMALQTFGAGRILYGSDEPLNLVRSKVFFNPKLQQQRLITEYPYHWVNSAEHEEFKELATDVVHTHWQVLKALTGAIEQLPKAVQARATEAVFYANAQMIFNM